ncbi:MAG: DUF1844 domain-containing protein [Sedimentisphaerales bacterium]|nr:DUF1844 domain-containing protein [Sedimentisphaerales bacterium]
MSEKEKEPKIIIDEDWKSQAQREKETLTSEQKTKQQEEQEETAPSFPPADLSALISMLATQAMFSLGLIHEKGAEPPPPDFAMAKFNIDMLDVIADKTKGNLTEEEDNLLQGTLAQLRMAFVQMTG